MHRRHGVDYSLVQLISLGLNDDLFRFNIGIILCHIFIFTALNSMRKRRGVDYSTIKFT